MKAGAKGFPHIGVRPAEADRKLQMSDFRAKWFESKGFTTSKAVFEK
jgi:hypothetical protein